MAAENGSFFQALFFWRDNPQHSSKPRHRRLETKAYDSKERLSFMAELLQQLTLLCWDKAISRRVWSWLRRKSLGPVLPQVWFVVSQGLTEGQSLCNSSPFPKELWKLCRGHSPSHSHRRTGCSLTGSLGQSSQSSCQCSLLFWHLESILLAVPCGRYEMYLSIAIYNATEGGKTLIRDGKQWNI